MKIVADANIFLAVVLEETFRSSIIQLTQGAELVAPEVLPFEIGNALSSLLRRGRIDPATLFEAWRAIQIIPVELRSVDMMLALEITAQYRIYAYDAYFLSCALMLRRPLLTLDRKMQKVAQDMGIKIMEV